MGQRLCAAAGYDPIGMARFFQSLRQAERIRFGFSRQASFLDTHPGLQERAAVNAARAGKLAWKRNPQIGDPRTTLLDQIDGLDVGERPESGVFVGSRFLHPVLGFQITFPRGWELSFNNRVVGARSPETGVIVYLTVHPETGDPKAMGEAWLDGLPPGEVSVERGRAVTVGRLPAWRFELSSGSRMRRVTGTATFLTVGDRTFRLTTVAPSRAARGEHGRALTAARSFRTLSPENRALVHARRLRLVTAEPDETIAQLGERVGDSWVPTHRAIVNGLFSHHVFAGGERVKVALVEPFEVEAAAPSEDEAALVPTRP
jgi:predicted Zn-dependent protease